MFEKTEHLFDTVIMDDASIVSEVNCLQSFKKGCLRAILLGNAQLAANMFLLNPGEGDRSLFMRADPHVTLQSLERSSEESKSGRTSAKKQAVPTKKIIFVNVTESAEQKKKDSFSNAIEAEALIDFL